MSIEDQNPIQESNDRDYSNDEITVFWRPGKCIHATTCYRELIEVFNPRKRPWVNLEGAETKEIMRVVDMCPTDALTYQLKGKKKEEANQSQRMEVNSPGPVVEVRVMKDGPLIVKGDFKVIGADKQEKKKVKMASFCRCGQSLNMPYCDGTHRKVGWMSE